MTSAPDTNPPATNAADALAIMRPRRSYLGTVGRKLMGVWGARLGLIWVGFVALLAIFAPLLANSHPLLMQTTASAPGGEGWSSPLYQSLTAMDVTLLIAFFVGLALVFLQRQSKGKVWVWLSIVCATYFAASLFDALRQFDSLAAALDSSWRAYQNMLSTNGAEDIETQVLKEAYNSTLSAMSKWWVLSLLLAFTLVGGWALSLYNLRRNTLWLGTALLGTAIVGAALSIPALRIMPPETVSYAKYRAMQDDGHIAWSLYTPIPYSPGDTLADLPIDQRFATPGYHPTEAEIARDMRTKALSRFGLFDDEVQTGRTIEKAYEAIERYRAEYQAKPDFSPATLTRTIAEIDAQAQTPQRTRLFLMGTTAEGQDLASRMIHAARIALAIGFIATGIAVVIGVFIGGLMGYFSGWVDLIGMRLVEVFSAIPVIFLLIAIVAFWGRDLALMMTILGLTGWVGYALFIRAEFLKLRKMDYVMAARASGTSLFSILFKHMLPNGITPVLVSASFGIAGMILTEATLSFIGLGLVNEPSWGQMLSNAQGVGGKFYWWLAMYPILAIFLTVFSYNMVGEAMRDALDPRAVKSVE